MKPIRVLELRSVRGTGGGPEKTILLGAARSDPNRYAVTVCYVRDARDDVFSIDNRAASLSLDYEEIVERHSFDPSVVWALRKLVRRRRIDIVHAHDYKTDLLAWLLSRCESVIPLSTAHGWSGHSRRERLLYYPLEKRLLRHFPLVIAVSDDIRQELIRCGARSDAVRTVLNGIEPADFVRDRSREADIRRRLGFADDDVVVASVGRLETEKRYDLLVEAFASLRPTWPRLKLVVVGEGGLRGALAGQVQRLGLGDVCQFLGLRGDVIDLHHAFNVFVQSSSNEGAPNAVLEAMALETPVVATAVGGTGQLVRDGVDGLLVRPGGADVLADAIRRTLSEPRLTAVRVASARRRVETDLSFETRMAAVESIYSELSARHKGSEAEVVPAGA